MAPNKLSPLPADIMESQLSTIDLLAAMFPSPGELEIPESTTQCVEKLRHWCENSDTTLAGIPSRLLLAVCLPIASGDGKKIQVNVSIPVLCDDDQDPGVVEQPPPVNYTLRQPEWLSKAELAELTAAMPQEDVFEAFEYIQEETLRFLQSREEQKQASGTQVSGDHGPIVRVWFYFQSLSTREKRDDLVNNAPGYSLTGFVLAGKPGVLCLEGDSGNIDAYMKFIKTHSWGDIPSHQKKVSEKFRETEDVQRAFTGMEEITDSLGERGGQRVNRADMQALEAWLEARGLRDAFAQVIF